MVKITDEAKQAKLAEKEAAKKAKAEARAKAKAEKQAKRLELKKERAEKKAARLAAKKAKDQERKAKKIEKAKALKAKEKAAKLKAKDKAKKAKAKERAKQLKLKAKAKAQKARERAKQLKAKAKAKELKAKEKAKALKLKAKEKKAVKNTAKVKDKANKVKSIDVFKGADLVSSTDKTTLKNAAKAMKNVVDNVADEFAKYDATTLAKKMKALPDGYEIRSVETDGKTRLTVVFTAMTTIASTAETKTPVDEKASKPAKRRGRKPKTQVDSVEVNDANQEVVNPEEIEPVSVETVPAGDLLNDNGEVATLPPEDDDFPPEDEDDNMNNDTIPDSRDETDEGLIENRRDFFGQFGDDGEVNENY